MGKRRSLRDLRNDAKNCQACPLFERATQTVFGEGPARASIMLVGEQPGDVEDREGRPFVGPAGRMLERALAEAGLAREDVYLTNAVKHFKWEPRGKRRIHEKPSISEIAACQDWLFGEITAVRPRVIVALGAVAARSLFGPKFRLLAERGKAQSMEGGAVGLGTRHPSSILRVPDPAAKKRAYAELVKDLKQAQRLSKT